MDDNVSPVRPAVPIALHLLSHWNVFTDFQDSHAKVPTRAFQSPFYTQNSGPRDAKGPAGGRQLVRGQGAGFQASSSGAGPRFQVLMK